MTVNYLWISSSSVDFAPSLASSSLLCPFPSSSTGIFLISISTRWSIKTVQIIVWPNHQYQYIDHCDNVLSRVVPVKSVKRSWPEEIPLSWELGGESENGALMVSRHLTLANIDPFSNPSPQNKVNLHKFAANLQKQLNSWIVILHLLYTWACHTNYLGNSVY